MSVKQFSNYWDFLEKQDKKTVITFSLSALGLLLFIAIAITLPFRDALFKALFPKPKVIAVAIPPSFVQSAIASISPASATVSATFSSPTTNGNFLMALLSVNSQTAMSIVSAPTGWIKITEKTDGNLYQWVYYFPNAPSQTQVSFTLGSSAKASITLAEFKDVEQTNPFDTQNTATGSGTISSSNITPTGADEFIIAALSTNASTTFASPSAGFAITAQNSTNGGSDASSGLFHYFNAGSSPVSNSVNLDVSSNWIHTLLAFKAAQIQITATPTPSVTSTDWPQLQHDSQRTGRTTVSVIPEYEVAWAWFDKTHIVKNFVSATGKSLTDGFELGFKATNLFSEQMQPIVVNGKTMFGALNGTFYAVNSLTGDNIWDFTAGGPILSTSAYGSGVVIVVAMDGKIYGLNENDGSLRWSYQTGAGINAAPVIANGTVYVGSRDGKFYAIDVLSGTLKWSQPYTTRVEPANPNSPFNSAPIVSPATISEDGSTVFFGAENMHFYALNTSNGTEKWVSGKLIGQSFLYTWPVVKGNKVIVRTMSSLLGAEGLMEAELDALCAHNGTTCTILPTIDEERTGILNWLTQNPNQKTAYVFDINTGSEPYQVAMGRVTGNNYAPHLPVVDNSDRVLTYWRSVDATLLRNTAYESPSGYCFGTRHCPDISALDLSNGKRIRLTPTQNSGLGPELDNGFQLTVGGNQLYLHNNFRGANTINLTTGKKWGIAGVWAGGLDGCPIGSFRGTGEFWGYGIIYYGNDADVGLCDRPDPRPPAVTQNTTGFAGITIASTNGQSMLYINEGGAYAIVAIRHKP